MIAIRRVFKRPLAFRSCGFLDESLKVSVNLIWVKKTAWSLCRNGEDRWGKDLQNSLFQSPRVTFVLSWLCGLNDFWKG